MTSKKSTQARLLPPLVAIGAVTALGACTGTPDLRIDAPQARISPMLEGVCAVFLRVANAGDGGDALLEAQADVPGAVTQIHAVREGRMVQAERLDVPARGVLELKPGGLHIMVFHLPKEAGAGYEFTLRLRFERSGEKRTSVKIVG